MKWCCLLCLYVLMVLHAKADVRLPAVLSSNMVLQQKSSVKLWGWADPNEKVFITTSWNHKMDSALTDGNAKWSMAIQTPSAGGPYTIHIKGHNEIVLENILVGEVWVCSGQSNMEMNYHWGLPQMKEDLPLAANKNIRFFHVPKTTATGPQEKGEGRWTLSDSNTVKSFSAVAYYFGKKLNAELDIPIGLIHASWGGTPAEAWTPSEVIHNNDTLQEAANKLNPSGYWPTEPGYAWNGMLAPLTNYSITGAIWYQGESNTGTASTYHQLFSSMIRGWREKWKIDFPFYYVQLAPFAYGNRNIAALLREAQHQTLSVPKTGMVVTTDLGDDTADIHPRNKKDVGLRLAALALNEVYGKNLPGIKSPVYSHMRIEKSRAVISFEKTSGLVQKGKQVTGFMIAGNDGVFHPAHAKIIGKTIMVWNEKIKEPVAVRYAFNNTATGNVFDQDGLPLAPFRTDNWPIDTSTIK